jgi:hypothetical protein
MRAEHEGAPVAEWLIVFPHGRHGLGLARDHDAAFVWPNLCARFLEGLGWRA